MSFRINPPTKIYVDKSPIHGWGVFASQDIEEGEVFEEVPVLTLPINKGETLNLVSSGTSNTAKTLTVDTATKLIISRD